MKKDSVILYANQYGALQRLSNEEMGQLFHAIFRWLRDENEETGELSPALFLAFQFMTLQFSVDNEKYLQNKKRKIAFASKKEQDEKVKKFNPLPRARGNVDEDVDVDENVDVDVEKEKYDDVFSFSFDVDLENKKADEENKAVTNFVEYWNKQIDATPSRMKKVRVVSPERKENILRIYHSMKGPDVARAVHSAMHSPFCNGDTKARNRPVDFDWLIRMENFTRLLEGNL